MAMEYPLSKRLAAEFLGTFWLVFGGCGTAVLAAKFVKGGVNTGLGVGFLGVAFAFGLTVLTGAYAFGTVSGGHFNPAVTLGLVTARRFGWQDGRFATADVLGYLVTQVVAGLVAGATVLGVAKSIAGGYDVQVNGLAANGYGSHSPGHYGLAGCLLIEVVLTGFFVLVILGAADVRMPAGFAPIAIGLSLTLIHLISIPVTNTSVNPARSTGVAFYAGNGAPGQLWLFWVAPILGGVLAGGAHHYLLGQPADAPVSSPAG
ncbi:MAG TPA: aquaporin Z [Jatrophihabitans sp.]|nr:aquaporin Z [Jatrophihabitans sp.]